MKRGKVYFVGAGPGDPKLLTIRGKECLEQAEVVLYDYLANPVLLDHVPAHRPAKPWCGSKAEIRSFLAGEGKRRKLSLMRGSLLKSCRA